MNLLVMENLFYSTQFSKVHISGLPELYLTQRTQIYDLKGSMRNRHAPAGNRVLLDENLVESGSYFTAAQNRPS